MSELCFRAVLFDRSDVRLMDSLEKLKDPGPTVEPGGRACCCLDRSDRTGHSEHNVTRSGMAADRASARRWIVLGVVVLASADLLFTAVDFPSEARMIIDFAMQGRHA